jgi:hypothetical protein
MSRFLLELPKNKTVEFHNSTYEIRNAEIIDQHENIKLIREQPTEINSFKPKSQKIKLEPKTDAEPKLKTSEEIRIDYNDEFVDTEVDYF